MTPEQDKFCDNNCVWTDHHPDCVRAEPEWYHTKNIHGCDVFYHKSEERKYMSGEITPLYTHPPVPMAQPSDWSVFNTGAEVASGLTFAEAWDYLTPERLDRGWSAVCVVNKDNIPTAQPKEPEQQPVAIPDCGEAGHADGACGNRECLPSFKRNTTPPHSFWEDVAGERSQKIAELEDELRLLKKQTQAEQNLSCKSTQARLATSWGYVKADEDQIPMGVLRAITNAGLTLLKTQYGYELRKLGPVVAFDVKE